MRPTIDTGASAGTAAIGLHRNILIVAVLGFFLIGIGAVGCVSFGIAEIISNDSIFLNSGLGEVLTVLGVYFTVPYLVCVGAFFVIVLQPKCLQFRTANAETTVLFVVTVLCFIIQQVFTNIYLVILNSPAVLAIVVLDVVVLAAHLYYKFDTPYASMIYTVVYAVKMAVQWHDAYQTTGEAVFGPNGVTVMLFLCIPLIQFPLYVMGTSAKTTTVVQRGENAFEGQTQGSDLVSSFNSNFNLFLSHLLHSLDIVSMYSFAFVEPVSNANQVAAPSQLRVMIIILICAAFLGNNISVLHLFYRRDDVEDAEIIFLPRKLREVSRSVDTSEEDGGSQRRRIFQYMLFMLVVCDVPLLLTRLELWRQQYSRLNIFVAKNIKSIADAVIMVMRADHTQEKQQQQAAGTRATQSLFQASASPESSSRLRR